MATMTMFPFWLLVICWSHCVLTQPLAANQHIALMSVYDDLGLSLDDSISAFSLSFFFFFFLFRPGCAPEVCVRFNASSNCVGDGLICAAGNVTDLYVLGSERSAQFR
jgi:hypothetical protein